MIRDFSRLYLRQLNLIMNTGLSISILNRKFELNYLEEHTSFMKTTKIHDYDAHQLDMLLT